MVGGQCVKGLEVRLGVGGDGASINRLEIAMLRRVLRWLAGVGLLASVGLGAYYFLATVEEGVVRDAEVVWRGESKSGYAVRLSLVSADGRFEKLVRGPRFREYRDADQWAAAQVGPAFQQFSMRDLRKDRLAIWLLVVIGSLAALVWIGTWCSVASVACGVFALFSGGVAVGALALLAYGPQTSTDAYAVAKDAGWTSVECTIERARPERVYRSKRRGTFYRLDLLFSYVAEGNQYFSSNEGAWGRGFNGREREARLSEFPPGRILRCRFNPHDPSQAVLQSDGAEISNRGGVKRALGSILVTAIGVLSAVIALLFAAAAIWGGEAGTDDAS